jgi:hypothetical protein
MCVHMRAMHQVVCTYRGAPDVHGRRAIVTLDIADTAPADSVWEMGCAGPVKGWGWCLICIDDSCHA